MSWIGRWFASRYTSSARTSFARMESCVTPVGAPVAMRSPDSPEPSDVAGCGRALQRRGRARESTLRRPRALWSSSEQSSQIPWYAAYPSRLIPSGQGGITGEATTGGQCQRRRRYRGPRAERGSHALAHGRRQGEQAESGAHPGAARSAGEMTRRRIDEMGWRESSRRRSAFTDEP